MLAKLPIDVGNLVVSGTKITMEQPHLSGFTRDARAYELSADAAAQDLTKPDIVELHNIHAKVQMQDKSTVEMSAAPASTTAKARRSSSTSNIVLSSSTGYRGRLSEAMVDIRKGHVVSEAAGRGEDAARHAQCQPAGDRRFRRPGAVRRRRDMTLMLNERRASPQAKTGVQ